jgi:hypothetical protein
MLRSPFHTMLSLNEESKMIATSLTGERQTIGSEGNVVYTLVNTSTTNDANPDPSSTISINPIVVSPLHNNVSISVDVAKEDVSSGELLPSENNASNLQTNRNEARNNDNQSIVNQDEEFLFMSPIRTGPSLTLNASMDAIVPLVTPEPVKSPVSPKYLGDVDETHNNSSLALGCNLEQLPPHPSLVSTSEMTSPLNPANNSDLPTPDKIRLLDEVKKEAQPTSSTSRKKNKSGTIPNYMKPTKAAEGSSSPVAEKQTKSGFLSRFEFLKGRKKKSADGSVSNGKRNKHYSSNASATSSLYEDASSIDESIKSKNRQKKKEHSQAKAKNNNHQIEQWLQMPTTAATDVDIDINDADEALKHRLLYPQTLDEYKDTVSPLAASSASTPRFMKATAASTSIVEGHHNMKQKVNTAAATRIASARAHLRSEANIAGTERSRDRSPSDHNRPRYMQPTSAAMQKVNPETFEGTVHKLPSSQHVPIPNSDSNILSINPTSSFETLESISTPKTSLVDDHHSPKKHLLLPSEFHNYMKPTGSSNQSVTRTPRMSSGVSVSSSVKSGYKRRTDVSPLTQPVAPKFSQSHHKPRVKSQEEIELEIIEEHTVKHPFRANPILIHDFEEYFKKSTHVLTTPKPTVPEPFHFASEDRALQREQDLLERRLLDEALDSDDKLPDVTPSISKREMEILEECKKQFRARPMPHFGASPPIKYNEKYAMSHSKIVGDDSNALKTSPSKCTNTHPLTKPVPFKFHTDERIEQRHAFEARIKQKEEREKASADEVKMKKDTSPELAFTPSTIDDRPFYIRAMERQQMLECELQIAREKHEMAELQEFKQFKARKMPNSSKAHYVNKYNSISETPTKKSDERQRAISAGKQRSNSNDNNISNTTKEVHATTLHSTPSRSIQKPVKIVPQSTKKSARIAVSVSEALGSRRLNMKKAEKVTGAHSKLNDDHEDFLDAILGEADNNYNTNTTTTAVVKIGSETVLLDEDNTTGAVTTSWSFDPFGSATNDTSNNSDHH